MRIEFVTAAAVAWTAFVAWTPGALAGGAVFSAANGGNFAVIGLMSSMSVIMALVVMFGYALVMAYAVESGPPVKPPDVRLPKISDTVH